MGVEIDLSDDVAIVTGGGSSGPGLGTGQAISTLLAEAGCKVLVVDQSAEHADRTVESVRSAGGHATPCIGDVSSEVTCRKMVEAAVDEFGKVSILVNNVGLFRFGDVVGVEDKDLDRVLAVNLKSAVFSAKYAIPAMRSGGGGAIVNIGSIGAFRLTNDTGSVAYSAAKGGIASLTTVMAGLYGKDHIRVNMVIPGSIRTQLSVTTMGTEDVDRRQSLTPLGPGGDAWDVAWATLFLVSDASKWISGAFLAVDGGLLAVSPLANQP